METTSKKKNTAPSNNAVPLTDIFYRVLRYWPWVLLSVFLCVGAGVIYILRTPLVYTRAAAIMVKDDSQSGSSVGAEEFADLGLFKNNTNIKNEVTSLRSSAVMEEVVKRLDLDVNYFTSGTFHDNVAYGTTLPVTVDFTEGLAEKHVSFNLDLAKGGTYKITDVTSGEQKFEGKTFSGALGDTITTPLGALVVKKSPYYTDGASELLQVEKMPVRAAVASYRGRLGVKVNAEIGSVIDLTFSDRSIERADDVLNMLIEVYNENWIKDRNQIAVSTSNFINERLGVIESELGHVDSDISSYKSEHLIPNVEAASAMYMSQNQNMAQEILSLKNQLQMTRYIRSYLSADNNADQLLPTNSGVDNVNLQSQIAEYNEKILQRNNLISKSSEKNPLVMAIDEQLVAMRGAMIASVDNVIVGLNTQIKNLQGSQVATTSKIASSPTQAKYLLSVERQQKVKESLYLFLLQKREENELSQAFTAYNTRVVEQPGGSGIPPMPNRRNVLLVSFLIGLAIPFGVAFLKETNNTKVRGRKDVENSIVPFLGEIPLNGKGDDTSKEFVVTQGNRNVINEAFRVLRTNLEFMRAGKDGAEVIAVTSFNPGSGKSFITMNLAMSLAIKNRKVLVIDGDMRHGSSSAYVSSPESGLSDLLNGGVTDVRNIMVLSPEHENLSILPVGSIPPNPTELLESPRFGEMLAALRGYFDYILIDCPPVEVVADAQIIDQYADRTIFVIRAGLFERSMLPELDRVYDDKKYRNMALILNGTASSQGRYGYSHGYSYGYGYGYAYGKSYGSKNAKK